RGEAGRGPARTGGRAAKALFRPVGPAAIRVSYSVGYTRERNMPTVGTNGSLDITAVITTRTGPYDATGIWKARRRGMKRAGSVRLPAWPRRAPSTDRSA